MANGLMWPPEPWTPHPCEDGCGWWEIDHAGGGGFCGRFSKETAERICACMNACRMLSTEVLMRHIFWSGAAAYLPEMWNRLPPTLYALVGPENH